MSLRMNDPLFFMQLFNMEKHFEKRVAKSGAPREQGQKNNSTTTTILKKRTPFPFYCISIKYVRH